MLSHGRKHPSWFMPFSEFHHGTVKCGWLYVQLHPVLLRTGYSIAGARNRRNRNRPGPTHGTAGICTLGTRVPVDCGIRRPQDWGIR